MNETRRPGAYRFRGHIRDTSWRAVARIEFSVVSVLCLAMAFGGGYLIGGCLS